MSEIFFMTEIFSYDVWQVCARACGWVESGCHDEHPRCEDWARRGMCFSSRLFMAHTCRESCGVCGFLAPENKVTTESSGELCSDCDCLGNTN